MKSINEIACPFLALVLLASSLQVSSAACPENHTELIIANHTDNYTVPLSNSNSEVVSFKDRSDGSYAHNMSLYRLFSEWDTNQPLCVPNKPGGDCHGLQMSLFDLDDIYEAASPESFVLTYGGEEVSLRGPYLTMFGDSSESLVADLGTCADTICEDDEALFHIEGMLNANANVCVLCTPIHLKFFRLHYIVYLR